MPIAAIIFYMFATVLLVSAAMTIFSRNPVHSVIWLVLAFFNGAGLMLLLGAEFLAMIVVIVYVGTVATLFLFVVMMLNIDMATLRARLARDWLLGVFVAVVLLAQLIIAAVSSPLTVPMATSAPVDADTPNIEAFGELLYTRYLFLVETAGLILLVALVGSVMLTVRRRPQAKRQKAGEQARRRPEDAVMLMRPELGQGLDQETIVDVREDDFGKSPN